MINIYEKKISIVCSLEISEGFLELLTGDTEYIRAILSF